MSDIPSTCPDCGGEPDLWTADGHLVAVRCTELAALRREVRAQQASSEEFIETIHELRTLRGFWGPEKASEAQGALLAERDALKSELLALRERAERAEAALVHTSMHQPDCPFAGRVIIAAIEAMANTDVALCDCRQRPEAPDGEPDWKARAQQAEAALTKFGRHRSLCWALVWKDDGAGRLRGGPCDCGLADALGAVPEEPT